jgi:hypothetical protein
MTKLVCGVGINDANYTISPTVEGRQITCQFYITWVSMLCRCYLDSVHAQFPTYTGCEVCKEWHSFSNFKAWMETQDWEGKQLDKDILLAGNKLYSPENCAFVDLMTNVFVTDRLAARGKYPVGVSFDFQSGKYKASCRNPITKKQETLGRFLCEDQAHLAWRKRKHELACELADLQTDKRISIALRVKYL